ncbi:hypothetical protein ID866_10754 [Astraeus odoratus]|nr:hypothetical protein ID866_10754 [Astraeus odoratus]
MDWKQH